MASYYLDGERYPVDARGSVARFRLHTAGLHPIGGTLCVISGDLIVDVDGALRSASFKLDPHSLVLETPTSVSVPDGLFGGSGDATIEFDTKWARPAGPGEHDLDGVLQMQRQMHVFTLHAGRGFWRRSRASRSKRLKERGDASPPLPPPAWYRVQVTGNLDRKDWNVRTRTLADDALLLLGSEVHFEIDFIAGPRQTGPETSTGAASSDRGSAGKSPRVSPSGRKRVQ